MSNTYIPQHVAIIMDGNRRWAKVHALSVFTGHSKGTEQVETIVELASQKGIKYITLWAFSTENWNRGETEVRLLMEVFRNTLKGTMVPRLIEKGVKLNIIGELHNFPKDIVEGVKDIIEKSRNNTRIYATIALNYGGRQEILRAVNNLLQQGVKEVNEETFSKYLYTENQPDPDLIIRTGGEERLSGFLPWQGVYSELYFTKTYWPDFNAEEFDKALKEFARRERRFGK